MTETQKPSPTLAQIMTDYAQVAFDHPDALGEILRAWAFPGNEYGCYSTFEVREDLMPVRAGRREFEFLWGRPFDDEKNDINGWCSIDAEEIERVRWFKHPSGIEMGWHWDGDGTLAFFIPELIDEYHNGCVVNSDCKKDYGWEFGEKLRIRR